jgi:hypothetical protein
VVVAATAPPASAASGRVLEVQDGATHVSADGQSLVFSGFTVTPRGGAVEAGELIVTVSFVPAAPSTADFLNSAQATVDGWACPLKVKATEVPIVFLGTVTADQAAAALEGQSVYLFASVNRQPGSFLVSVSAPSAGFQVPVVRTFPVSLPMLSLDVAQSYTEATDGGTDGRCQLVFDGLGVGISGGDLPAGELTLTVSFGPAAPSTEAALDPLNKNADPWDYDRIASNVPEVVFTYHQALRTNDDIAAFPFGPYLETQFPAADQPGSFVLTASAPGYASATAEIRADARGRLAYETGASYVAPAIDGGWQVNFDGAQVTASVSAVALGPLTMVASFEPTGGFTDQMVSTVPADKMPGWTPPAQGSTGTSLTYTTTGAVTPGSPTVIPDGGVFRNDSTNPGSRGTFKLDFSAPGQQPTSHTYLAPPPYITATFDPGGNYVLRSDSYYYLWMTGCRLRVQGGSLPANALAMTVSFEPTAPGQEADLRFYPNPFMGWSQPFTQLPMTQAPSGQYVHLSPVTDGALLNIGPQEYRFSTVGEVSGTFVLTFSSLVSTSPAFRPLVVRVPTSSTTPA